MPWQKILGRSMLPLTLIKNCADGVKNHTSDCFDIDFNFMNYLRYEGNVSFDKDEWSKFRELIIGKDKEDHSYFFRILQKHRRYAELVLLYSKSLSDINPKNKSEEELKNITQKYFDLLERFIGFIYPTFNVEEILSEKIKDEIEKSEQDISKQLAYIASLTSPIRSNEANREKIELLKLKDLLNKTNEQQKEFLIKNHETKFGWLSFYWFAGKKYTKEDIIKRLEKIDLSNILEEEQKEYHDEIKCSNTIKSLDIKNRKILDTITILRELSYAHTADVELICQSGFFIRPIFEEIAERKNIPIEDLWFLTKEELFEKDISEKIEQRKKGHMALLKDGVFSILTGEDYQKIKKELKEEIKADHAKGMPVQPGIIKGKAKVIAGRKDYHLIEDGDILITSMTTPDAVPLLTKVKAIITDEGGVLCHAAIIARELKIPGIIGTKIGTQIFKTGDLVEVDANKGVVKKL
jgi:phosphoenolpyruvate synthase/pyruvate phosphate dikinase